MAKRRATYDGPLLVEEITKWVAQVRESGTIATCPLCQGVIHVAERRLRLAMVRALRHMSDLGGRVTSADMKRLGNGAAPNDWTYLSHWKLIQKHPAGPWEITTLGRRFLAGEIAVPKFVHIEHNSLVGQSEEMVSIRDVVDDKFDIDEFIRPWAPEKAPARAQGEFVV